MNQSILFKSVATESQTGKQKDRDFVQNEYLHNENTIDVYFSGSMQLKPIDFCLKPFDDNLSSFVESNLKTILLQVLKAHNY